MSNKYVDVAAIIQIIGCVFNNPSLLDERDKYVISENDFCEDFHKVVFGSIYNIHMTSNKVSINTILDYLAGRPKYEAIFKKNKGIEYLAEAMRTAREEEFNYYYNRLKKFSLLRAYDNIGIDVSYIYDPINVIDIKKKQEQEDWLDNHTLTEIAERIDKKIEDIKYKYIQDDMSDGYQAGEGIIELIEDLEKTPEIGIPLYGSLINTITRGARLRKLYLRSAPTGIGKTRSMIADACTFACGKLYKDGYGWVKHGSREPTLFIATEQDKSEVQTMMLAFLSNVNEDHILRGDYLEGERQRVIEAAQLLQNSPIWVEELPDFSLQDVENKIKKNIREHNVVMILFDYLQTSLKILEEISHKSGGVKLREDNILFMLSAKLKDIANQYGVFILTSTQLNSSYQSSDTPDQNLLRGAKSIADRCDCGLIILPVTQEDLAKIEPILGANPLFPIPSIKISVYKNRRGPFKGIYLWCSADLGTCRIQPQFATKWDYELINVADMQVIVD